PLDPIIDAKALEHADDLHATRAPAEGHGLGSEQRTPELLLCADVRPRCAGAHGPPGQGMGEIDAAASNQLALLEQRLIVFVRSDEQIAGGTGSDPLDHSGSACKSNVDLVTARTLELWHDFDQRLLGGRGAEHEDFG